MHICNEEAAVKYLVKEIEVYNSLWRDIFSFLFALR
jgi:hypothetical protein